MKITAEHVRAFFKHRPWMDAESLGEGDITPTEVAEHFNAIAEAEDEQSGGGRVQPGDSKS